MEWDVSTHYVSEAEDEENYKWEVLMGLETKPVQGIN